MLDAITIVLRGTWKLTKFVIHVAIVWAYFAWVAGLDKPYAILATIVGLLVCATYFVWYADIRD